MFRIVGFPFFHFGKVTVGALQLFTPLAAVFVVGPPRHACALSACFLKNFAEAIFSLPNSRLLLCSIFDPAMQRQFIDVQCVFALGMHGSGSGTASSM